MEIAEREETMLTQAINDCRDLALPIDFILADAQQLPFADNSFTAARVDRTLQHILNPRNVLREMVRVV
jgi:ubiquinone/menaquinone biosynthesis C-methylase UbiE